MSSLELTDDAMVCDQPLGLILLADERRDADERALRSVAPGMQLERGRGDQTQAQRRGAVGGPECQPCVGAPEPDGPVADAVAEGREGGGEVERPAERHAPLGGRGDHRRTDRRIGLGPDCACSNSARLRSPV